MVQSALVTGADRGLGYSLVEGLLQRGWRVFAGQYMLEWPQLSDLSKSFRDTLRIVPLDVTSTASLKEAAEGVSSEADTLDLLINNAGVTSPTSSRSIREAQDYAEMQRMYDTNSLGPLRVVETFLPLMDAGTLKRLCFVSSEAGSIKRAGRKDTYGYCMSKAALNMAAHILFKHLRPEGYTFRVYHPGWIRSYMSGQKSAEGDMEPEQAALPALEYFLAPLANENTLVMHDWRGEEWPW